jgi:hypothetical protein
MDTHQPSGGAVTVTTLVVVVVKGRRRKEGSADLLGCTHARDGGVW